MIESASEPLAAVALWTAINLLCLVLLALYGESAIQLHVAIGLLLAARVTQVTGIQQVNKDLLPFSIARQLCLLVDFPMGNRQVVDVLAIAHES